MNCGRNKLVCACFLFLLTLISGGNYAGNNLAIQEIMILPVGAKNFDEALQIGAETYHHLKAVITEKFGPHGCNVGEAGGFAPNISRYQVRFGLQNTNKSGQNFKTGEDMIDMSKYFVKPTLLCQLKTHLIKKFGSTQSISLILVFVR